MAILCVAIIVWAGVAGFALACVTLAKWADADAARLLPR